jgi:soluble lytic murein transglycosylase-like protein
MNARATLLMFLLTTGVAHADIYGYIDAGGTTHLATERIDDHYTLFLKTDPEAAPSAEPPLAADQSLMKSRLFQRLVSHPNIAKYEPMIRAASLRHGLDPHLVKAMIAVESGFEPSAVSDKGAVGLMQILPATGERYGVRADRGKTVDAKLADPMLNLEIGTRYLADLRRQFANRPELALAAYNAGENAVIRYRNAIPPFPETVAYVKLVDQFHTYYDPSRISKSVPVGRIRVTLPAARRNMPDPNVPLRLPAPEGPAVSIAVPPSATP